MQYHIDPENHIDNENLRPLLIKSEIEPRSNCIEVTYHPPIYGCGRQRETIKNIETWLKTQRNKTGKITKNKII